MADIATGVITNLAGAVGVVGSADGVGGLASFRQPWGLSTDGTNLYVTQYNSGVRKIDIATGTVSTLLASTSPLSAFAGIVTDGKVLYYADTQLHKMQ